MTTIAIVLSACAAIKLGYENSESIGIMWINRYLDLDRIQEQATRAKIARFMVWHRSTQLPDYIRLAAELKGRVQATITTSDGNKIFAELYDRWHTLEDHEVSDFADLAMSLRPEQISFLAHKFADNNKDYRNDFMQSDPTKRKKAHYDKTLDRAEYWFGRLDSGQREILRQASDAQPYNEELWMSERIARQQELGAMLTTIITQKPPRADVENMIRAYYKRMETSPDPTHRAYIAAMNASNIAISVQVANLARPDQQQYAAKKLQGWMTDLQGLE